MNPPRMASLLLVVAAGESQAEYVAGDLYEEFVCLCEQQGARQGRRWYQRQVFRSLAPLVAMRMRSTACREAFANVALGVLLPLVLLDQLWRFVYSQIPLKDGSNRDPWLLVVNLCCLCLCAGLAGWTSKGLSSVALRAIASVMAAALALTLSSSTAPVWYISLALAAAPASCLLTLIWRRTR